MECFRAVPPSAQVGQAWENVRAMNGTPPYRVAASSEWSSTEERSSGDLNGVGGGGSSGSGMGLGSRLVFSVAEVGRGSREMK